MRTERLCRSTKDVETCAGSGSPIIGTSLQPMHSAGLQRFWPLNASAKLGQSVTLSQKPRNPSIEPPRGAHPPVFAPFASTFDLHSPFFGPIDATVLRAVRT